MFSLPFIYFHANSNPLPTIVGPNGFYITDHHHLARSLLNADVHKDEKVIYCEITYNWGGFDNMEDFWQQMVLLDQVWLYDEKGYQPIAPGINIYIK